MPVIRGGDEDGVDVVEGKQFPVVLRDLQPFPFSRWGVLGIVTLDKLLGVGGSNLGHFRKANDLGLGIPEQAVRMAAPLLARPNHRHVDTVVGGIVALGRPNV